MVPTEIQNMSNIWKNFTADHVRKISLVITFVIATSMTPLVKTLIDMNLTFIAVSVSYLSLGLSYLIISSLLFKILKASITPLPATLKGLFKSYFILLSLNLFNGINVSYRTITSEKQQAAKEWQGFLVFFISIIAAFYLYKVCSYFAFKRVSPQTNISSI